MQLFQTKPTFNVQAAMELPEMRLHAQALRRAGIEINKRMSVAELDLELQVRP